MPTFPSLSLSPTAAEIGKIVCESPQLKKQVHNSQVEIWGLLLCISPPFVLPSKASPLSASVAKSAESLAWMVPKSLSSNRDQQGRLCWVLLWSYACVLTSLAVSIMLYCPLLANNVCMSTFLLQWLLGVQCCLW